MKAKKLLAVLLVAVMLLVPVTCFANAAGSIVTNPIKTAYTDCEFFNPQGLIIQYNGTPVIYTPDNANFAFMPSLNDHLSVDTKTIDVYYNNEFVGTVAITVDHVWGDITYLDNNFHGRYCLGCGTVEERLPHNVSEYIPNDDGGLFIQQSETGVCSDCHAEVTRKIVGSEKFDDIFDPGNLTETETTIITYIQLFLVTLIQTLTGIR